MTWKGGEYEFVFRVILHLKHVILYHDINQWWEGGILLI